MNDIIQKLTRKLRFEQELADNLEKKLQNSPDGKIHVSMINGHPRFYRILGQERCYLGDGTADLIRELIEKEYYTNMLKEAAAESCTIRRFIRHFDPEAHVRIYENMHEQKKRWISPLILSDEDYAEKWLAEAQAECALRKNTFPKETEYQTMNGELVRSKSEKMLADGFHSFGVRYVYEPAVILSDGTVFSDFLALNQRTRVAKYVEHFGMMDKPEYAADAVRKIKRYEKSGFFLGDLLVVTWETSLNPLGTNEIEAMIRKHFL